MEHHLPLVATMIETNGRYSEFTLFTPDYNQMSAEALQYDRLSSVRWPPPFCSFINLNISNYNRVDLKTVTSALLSAIDVRRNSLKGAQEIYLWRSTHNKYSGQKMLIKLR